MDILTQDYINELALKVISAYDINIPIKDIEEIVQQMGGKIEEKFNFDDLCDGTICKSGANSFYIAISPFQKSQRRTFTIAHELDIYFCIWDLEQIMNYGNSKMKLYIEDLGYPNKSIKQMSLQLHY